jgi:hypothetical protein
LWLEWPGTRICDLLLGPTSSWAQLADHLDEAVRQLGTELAARWEVDAELEALWTSATWVEDLVLDRADGPSSLAASLSSAVDLLEGWVDVMAANRVRWGTRLVSVAIFSHFPELQVELELLRSWCNTVLMED